MNLPPRQQEVRDKCFHPTGTFTPFAMEDVEKSVPARFESIVQQYPNRLAIKTQRHSLTFVDLNQFANRIAHAIIAVLGEGHQPVGLLIDKGAPLIATFVAVLKAGKIYVPCEPWFPMDRITAILDDVEAALVVTDSQNFSLANQLSGSHRPVLNIDDLTSSVSSENVPLSLTPDTLAYVLFTSGSMGRPKGVLHTHRSILHHSMRGINSFHLCPADRMTLMASLCTSQACSDIYLGLLSGAGLYPWDTKNHGLSRLGSWIRENRLTYFGTTASVFRYFVADMSDDEDLTSVRLVRLGGEVVQRFHFELYKKHFTDACIFVNAYSSTETRSVCFYFADKHTHLEQDLVPVGYAVTHTQVAVVGEAGEEVEKNRVGEIIVKSRYLAVGYWRHPEETRAAFSHDSEDSDLRCYRTGDLGRMGSDGCLIPLDRKGDQVKIRGFRVEPREIECVLRGHDKVKEAVVISRKNDREESYLIAYVLPLSPDTVNVEELKDLIAHKLPDYMVPSFIVMIDQIPLTNSGKLDRRALPEPKNRSLGSGDTYVAPGTCVEQELVEIWADLLQCERVGIDDSFFAMGGHSLLATQLISRIRKLLRVEIGFRELFECPTIRQIAMLVEDRMLT